MDELPINTKRLRLRRFQADDLDAFCAYRSDPEVGRYQGWNAFTLEEAGRFISQQQIGMLDTPGRWFQIAIAERKTNAIIGDIGLCLIGSEEAEIGFSLARRAQGAGFGSEAVEAIARTLLDSGRINTLRATTDTRNVKSIALLVRLGFDLKRTTAEIFHGQWCQQHRYVLIARRPEERGQKERA